MPAASERRQDAEMTVRGLSPCGAFPDITASCIRRSRVSSIVIPSLPGQASVDRKGLATDSDNLQE
ncbi:hypothetical protein Acor_32150 [Acrocarpospora corrugata]|uniref:Uncharacterized protein n=1 Tax=Acrocarpospora corrugata TaxID=35763 RepID=A0A5M3W1Z4_9ACTN|nr:hypothetical protein Acor_32150 [Acrocarpospora corrugata]